MAMCWYCYWGWPKPIADIYDKYINIAGESAMHYGPAHVVWDDENWDCAETCLDGFDACVEKYENDPYAIRDEIPTPAQYEAVRASLKELSDLPEDIRRTPLGYEDDDWHPEKFPPPSGWEMVRR